MKKITILFTLLCTGALNGMELKSNMMSRCMALTSSEIKPSPITFAETYYHFSHDLLLTEIAQQIFLLRLELSDVDLKEFQQSYEHPESLVKYIKKLIDSCGYSLASELCERFFSSTKISICDIKYPNDWAGDRTSLHYAAEKNYPEVIRILIKIAGGDAWKLLTMKDYALWTALHRAAFSNSIESTNFLLDAAGDKVWELLTMRDIGGRTALHRSAFNKNIVMLLLNAAGDNAPILVAMRDIDNSTALNHAAGCNKIENMKLILDSAGDKAWELLTVKDNHGCTIFDNASSEKKELMQKYMTMNK